MKNREALREQRERLRATLDCRVLAERYGMKRTGRQGQKWESYQRPGGERHPSFGVVKDGWYDFAREEHGDVFSFIMRMENLPFPEAVQRAIEYAGGETVVSNWTFIPPPPPTPETPWLTTHWQERANALQATCEQHAAEALDYCAGRGLFAETVYAFRIGFSQFQPGLPNGVSIPTYDSQGRLVAIKVRDLSENPARKYGQLAGSRQGTLFGLPLLNPTLPVVLVEGEFDAILGYQEAGQYANFCTVGSSSLALDSEALATLTAAPAVYLLPDRDEAGERAATRWAADLEAVGVRPVMLAFPEGLKDLTDYHQRGGDVKAWFSRITARYLPHGVRLVGVACGFEDQVEVYERVLDLHARGFLPDSETFTLPDCIDAATSAGDTERLSLHWWYNHVDTIPENGVFLSIVGNDTCDLNTYVTNTGKNGGRPPARYRLNSLSYIREQLALRLPYRSLEHELRYNKTFLPSPRQMQSLVGGDLWLALEALLGDVQANRAEAAMERAWPRLKSLAAHEAEQHGTPPKMTTRIQGLADREHEMGQWLADDTRLDLEPEFPYVQAMLRAEVRAGFLTDRASTNHELAFFCGISPTGFTTLKDAAGVLVTREKHSVLVPISAQKAAPGEENAMSVRPEGRVIACDAVGEFGGKISFAAGPMALNLANLAAWEQAGVHKVRIHTDTPGAPALVATQPRQKRAQAKRAAAAREKAPRETRGVTSLGIELASSAVGVWLTRAAALCHTLAGQPVARTWDARIASLEALWL